MAEGREGHWPVRSRSSELVWICSLECIVSRSAQSLFYSTSGILDASNSLFVGVREYIVINID